MTISFYNMLVPLWCLKTAVLKNKRSNYDNLKSYIVKKLCIKQLLVKMNEVEKLKIYTLDEEKKMKFENLNPFPKKHDEFSIWENKSAN